MKKKPFKVEEPAAPYGVQPPAGAKAGGEIRYSDAAKVRGSNAKLMEVHRKVLQKLAR